MSFHVPPSQQPSQAQAQAQAQQAHSGSEKGYSWLFFSVGRSWFMRLLVALFVLGGSIGFYVWYNRFANDASPDSLVGYGYALAGTVFLILAATLYRLRRRSRKRAIGQLNAALNWHVLFAVLGLILLFMHSFGNFNARTGTFALYGLIALVVSGFIGRLLDRLMPWLIAGQVRKALTSQGDDRIESISEKLQAIVIHNAEDVSGFATGGGSSNGKRSLQNSTAVGFSLEANAQGLSAHAPWDLAYISLEATPQELERDARQHRLVPDKHSPLTRPGALMPGAQEQISALQDVQRAMQHEQFYRYIIRYWRVFHIALALLTLGLTVWHIIFALQLLIPTLIH